MCVHGRYDLAAEAGKELGSVWAVHHETVRRWSAEYISGEGTLKPDGRGHYERELLILEEDLQQQ